MRLFPSVEYSLSFSILFFSFLLVLAPETKLRAKLTREKHHLASALAGCRACRAGAGADAGWRGGEGSWWELSAVSTAAPFHDTVASKWLTVCSAVFSAAVLFSGEALFSALTMLSALVLFSAPVLFSASALFSLRCCPLLQRCL